MKPLGQVLQQADLISSEQVEIALKEQTEAAGLRLGEILASHGWLKQKTADFFSQQWPAVLKQNPKQPLGQYLEEAGLLNEQQIRTILAEQPQKNLRFGELAVLKGWLKPTTIQFFLEHLTSASQLPQHIWQYEAAPIHASLTQAKQLHWGIVVPQQNNLKNSHLTNQSVLDPKLVEQELAKLRLFSHSTIKFYQLDEKASRPEILMAEVLFWTDGQPVLTDKLCQLLAESDVFVADGAEATTVQQLVQTHLIDNWETQVSAEHLQGMRDNIIRNQQCDPLLLLELYQKIWLQGEVPIDNSPEQAELLRLGLVTPQQDKLKLGNRIYCSVFDRDWVKLELDKILHPSLAETAIYIPNPSAHTLNTSNTMPAPDLKITKRILVLLAIAGLMICGSGLMVLGFSLFKWLQIETIFQRGNALMHQGEYQQAIAKYNNILKIDSNYYQSWTNRGYALARLKEYNKMLESCTTATIINPEAVYAWNCRGEALYNLKQPNEAIAAFDKAIALNSKDPVFWINKTEALLAIRQTDTALSSVNQAIELLKKTWEVERKDDNAKELAVALGYQGRVLLQKQDYQAALAAYEQALKYNPNYFVALRGKGIAFQGLKQDDRAIAQFYNLLDRPQLTNNQQAEAWYYLGLSLCEFRQTQRAIAAFDRAIQLKPNYQAAERAKQACFK